MGDYAITLIEDDNTAGVSAAPTFDEMFNEHHEKVLKAAYRVTGNLQDAEDVLQTVFLRLLNRKDHPDLGVNPAAYLCRAAINAALDLLRSRKRKQTESLNEEIHQAPTGAADSDVRELELKLQLRRALLALDQSSAQIFALRFFEEFSNAEIAKLLDTSANSIAVTLHRAREKLQKILGELEGEDR